MKSVLYRTLFDGISRARSDQSASTLSASSPTKTPNASPSEAAAGAHTSLSRRSFLLAAGATVVTMLGPPRRGYAATEQGVKVGFVLPGDGARAPQAKSLLAGFDLFVRENAAQSVPINPLIKDAGPHDERIVETLTGLVITERVDFIVAPLSLEASQKAIHAVAGSETILFVTNPSIRLVAGEMCLPASFRVSANTYQAAQPLGAWALKHVGRKVFITGQNDALENEQADFFAHAFERSGGLFGDRLMVPAGADPLATIGDRVKAAKPDFLFCSFRGDAAVKFVKDIKGNDTFNLPVVGPDSLTGFPATLDRIGSSASGIRTLTYLENPQELVQRIEEKAGEKVSDAALAAQGYDVAAIVLKAAGKTDKSARSHESMVRTIEEIEIHGPRGKLRFDKNHEPILEAMVQEWAFEGGNPVRKIASHLGECTTPDFGCGRIGFPKSPYESEPKGPEIESKEEKGTPP